MADELTPKQEAEVQMALRHMGRAMKALSRAGIPISGAGQPLLLEFNRAELKLCQASDQFIDALMRLGETEADSATTTQEQK